MKLKQNIAKERAGPESRASVLPHATDRFFLWFKKGVR